MVHQNQNPIKHRNRWHRYLFGHSLTLRITDWQWRAAESPVRVDDMVRLIHGKRQDLIPFSVKGVVCWMSISSQATALYS